MSTVNVDLLGTWLTNLLTGQQIQLFNDTAGETDGVQGQVVSYAGRNVSESTTTRVRSSPIVFNRVDAVTVEILRDWIVPVPAPILLIDDKGWYRTGTFYQFNPVPYSPAVPLWHVSVTFTDIDYPTGV
jgi:hypothetical protein